MLNDPHIPLLTEIIQETSAALPDTVNASSPFDYAKFEQDLRKQLQQKIRQQIEDELSAKLQASVQTMVADMQTSLESVLNQALPEILAEQCRKIKNQ